MHFVQNAQAAVHSVQNTKRRSLENNLNFKSLLLLIQDCLPI